MSDNKFLVEFVVNFRWALHFFLEELLYTTESNYSVLVGEATNVLDAISLASFTNISSLASVPLGILQLAKEASIYLLVAEGILGSSPPTTHSFLLQHKGSSLTSSAVRREKSDTMHRGPYGVGVNRSTESATVRTAPSSDCSVTSQTIGSITDLSYFETPMSSQTGRKRPQRDDQAMFLLVRWLVSENILPTSELSFTLEIQPEDYEEHTRPTGSGIPPRREGSKRSKSPTFRLHNRMATRLAQLVPFYLGAHVIVSRALLFTHCSRLLYSEDVVEHIKKLRPRVSLPQGNTISVEEALLRWLQTVVFLHLNEAETEKRSKAPNATYGPQLSSNLRALYNQLEQSGPHQFCTLLQDGVASVVGLGLV
ncbi:hypothetical protein ADEAN_000048500 [Angomonas deanei]|uniref:Uncharacterized protein n=1 Tax=Angomonas deanei TaxID=59799 RepID=A0A7G2BZV7_9TRYP|nr:hypothetical protein ADEAN_000048500 [Angomonas deanei]